MMKLTNALLLLTAMTTLSVISAAPSYAQDQGPNAAPNRPLDPSIKTTFVHLGNGVPGVLYEPVNPGPKAQIAVFVMHSAVDYLTHSACTELSRRGYRVLCANDANSRTGEFNDGELYQVLLDAKAAVVYLRQYPGVRKVVLWGHSGGATVMTAYQDIAENGVKACQDDVKIFKCPTSVAGMPPADGVILGDANWGIANDVLTGTDPAVIDNGNGKELNPDLDMYNPGNGFDAAGSAFSQQFIHRFLVAQGQRNNSLVALALDRLALIEAGKGEFADDEPFIIAGSLFTANKLYTSDMRLLAHTQKPWPLLHADGSITTGIVPSLRVPTATVTPTDSLMHGALKTTVRNFLSTYAIRVTGEYGYGEETAESGVIWKSSMASNPGNVEGITVPFLAMAMTGSFEMGSAETIHNHVKSADNTLIYIEGATHVYTPCKKCEKTPGQFGDTVKTIYDYADGWLSKSGRFL